MFKHFQLTHYVLSITAHIVKKVDNFLNKTLAFDKIIVEGLVAYTIIIRKY